MRRRLDSGEGELGIAIRAGWANKTEIFCFAWRAGLEVRR